MIISYQRAIRNIIPSVAVLLVLAGCGGDSDRHEEPATADTARTEEVSLDARLTELRESLDAQAPPELREIGKDQLDILRTSGILDSALNVGDTMPDFALPNAVGDTVRSQKLLETGSLVLTFYRGVW